MSAPSTALDPKVLATLKARCARLGIELYVTDDDAGKPLFVAVKWAMTRQLHSVDDVEAFILQAGGAKA